MNFKKFFFRDYYRGIKLSKPLNKEEFVRIKKDNSPIFDAANEFLQSAPLLESDFRLLQHPITNQAAFKTIEVTTTYPGLIIGTGYIHETNNESEFKLGFSFDNTTGLPCIEGTSIKGVFRNSFPQFNEKHPFKPISVIDEIQQSKVDFIANALGWEENENKNLLVHQLEQVIFEGVDLEKTNTNFVSGKVEINYKSIYHRFCFFSGYISNVAESENLKIFDLDTITPHGNDPFKNPTPLNFLKIRPKVTFTIPVQLFNIEYLSLESESIKNLFSIIIKINGIGAKTNVGYGQFE